MSEEYNLTFLEAMKALCEGKEVMCEYYPWVLYNQDGTVMFSALGDTFGKFWFDKDDVSAKWRVVE